jgi:hypothetical protein
MQVTRLLIHIATKDCQRTELDLTGNPTAMQQQLECVKEEMLCDGVTDCSNSRDEEDCYLLGGDLNNLNPGTAATAGYLGVWAMNMSRYLPMGVEDGMGWEVIYARSKLACAGVVESVPSFELVPSTGD